MDNTVELALVKYGYSEISNQQLADHMGFSPEEQRMLTMFWEPAFNGSWIYLSDEIILEQITNESGKDALTNFYKRVLLTNDYRKVEQLAIFMKDYIVALHKHIMQKQLDYQNKLIEAKDAALGRFHKQIT